MSQIMPGYETKRETISIADIALDIVSLKDKKQFYDPDQEAEKLGISSSMWPISGLIWPSGIVLAHIVNTLNLDNLRVLEVGCGIAIASLIASYKKVDITASDFHPLTKTFLTENAKKNNLGEIKHIPGDWNFPLAKDGKYDLIIGSDLLYERNHYEILSQYLDSHLNRNGKILLVDPGRSTAKKIRKTMENIGYQHLTETVNDCGEFIKNGKFRLYTFSRVGKAA